jgi:hypothetical protein
VTPQGRPLTPAVAVSPASEAPHPPRRPKFISTPTGMLAVLVGLLVVAFVWWRFSVQRARVESYWGNILVAGAQLNRSRTDEWVSAQHESARLIGLLAARGRGPGSAFETAIGVALADQDVAFVSIRDGPDLLRCTGVPLRDHCVAGSGAFSAPSAEHPQARRVRPVEDGRVLIQVVAPIPSHNGSEGGVVTLWLDPERSLFPRLMATARSVTGARSVFVNRLDNDTATVITSDSTGAGIVRRRIATANLPAYIARAGADSDWVASRDENQQPMIAGHVYIPSIRWDIYRVMTAQSAAAPFRRGIVTESFLAFVLGSFVIGLAVWSVRERSEQRVRAELIQARLESLQAQLRPHFLFNALNTIATLIHEDPKAADTMLVRLADLLRLSLEHSDDAEIPLRRELELFGAYISVERVRFGNALRVTSDIAPDTYDIPVMRWLLQPLAENAIKHGAAYSRGEANMELRARREGDVLEIVLGDDGPKAVSPAPVEGVGLSNTRRRLETLYGGDATLALRQRAGGGTEAVLRIPIAQSVPVGESAAAVPGPGSLVPG